MMISKYTTIILKLIHALFKSRIHHIEVSTPEVFYSLAYEESYSQQGFIRIGIIIILW